MHILRSPFCSGSFFQHGMHFTVGFFCSSALLHTEFWFIKQVNVHTIAYPQVFLAATSWVKTLSCCQHRRVLCWRNLGSPSNTMVGNLIAEGGSPQFMHLVLRQKKQKAKSKRIADILQLFFTSKTFFGRSLALFGPFCEKNTIFVLGVIFPQWGLSKVILNT